MGGTTQETNKTTNTNQKTSGTQSGNTNSSQFQAQALTPWVNTQGLLGGILNSLASVPGGLTGAESGALDQLSGVAAAGNPYASAIGGAATGLLGGGPDRTGLVNDAYRQYQAALTPYAGGDYLDPSSNPALKPYLDTIANDVSNRVNGLFAGAGRDLSGLNQQALARGIAQGQAPVLLDAYNQAQNQRVGAINSLYGAGGQTAGLLSGLDQARLSNQQAGIGAADSALRAQQWGPMQMLAIEAQRRGIPLQSLAAQYGMVLPAAQAFGTQTGSGSSAGSSTSTSASHTAGTDTSQTTQNTPFNPWSLAPLALMPLTGGASGFANSLAGGALSGLGGGLFSSLSNGFMGPGSFRP